MSFTQEVKKELCERQTESHEELCSRLFGMFSCFYRNRSGKYLFHCESEDVIRYFTDGLSCLLAADDQYEIRCEPNGYILCLKDKISTQSKLCNCNKNLTGDILCGLFLASGTLNEPEKNYRLDFRISNDGQKKLLKQIFAEFKCNLLFSERAGVPFAYIRDSDAIEELLTVMGAESAAMKIINIKIYKNIRNDVNRITNCETANISKSVHASANIIAKIQRIIDVKGMFFIPEELRETAYLRIRNPEMSLRELAGEFAQPISRSGLYHRLQKLSRLADTIADHSTQEEKDV